MKKQVIPVLLLMLAVLTVNNLYAQLDSTTFDFWVGKWDASWQNPQGVTEKGTNFIEKILDGRVIQEHFVILSGQNKGFKGTSISVYNPVTKSYHQAWADNSGGYFDFIAEVDGEKKIFTTQPRKRGDDTIIQRMVFYDIKHESFTWDWELTKDHGKTWSLQWRIHYTRIE